MGEIGIEIAAELLVKELMKLGKKALFCKSRAKELRKAINQFLPIIQEIRGTGMELPQPRKTQLDQLTEDLLLGLELAKKASTLSRWNLSKNLQLYKKMEKLEKQIVGFVNYQLQFHTLADVHHNRVDTVHGLQRLEERLRFMQGTIRRMEKEMNSQNLCLPVDFPVTGMRGSGKTTLRREICRDLHVQGYFNSVVMSLFKILRHSCRATKYGRFEAKAMGTNHRKLYLYH